MTDLDRLYALITSETGITRIRDVRLEEKATERAFEARQQVGLNFTGTDADNIVHPSQLQCETRLGPEWINKGVGEIGNWLYQWTDPIQALVRDEKNDGTPVGFMNSEEHAHVLTDTKYEHWGIGLYDELPSGESEINRRYYCIIWMGISVPAATSPTTFSDVPESHKFFDDIEWCAQQGIVFGYKNGTFRPSDPITRGQMCAMLHRALT